jgi:hypothetical protein
LGGGRGLAVDFFATVSTVEALRWESQGGPYVHDTIFEQSEPVTSPGGVYSVAVSSWTSSANEAVSQALVSAPAGGSGLIAFYSPRVSMGFVWNGDDELIVRYPDDLPAPRIDVTNRSFGHGGRGRVIYQAVSRADIRPLHWTREGELRTIAEEPLERGILLTFETDGQVQYSYSYYDVQESDSSSEALQAQGLQGGGYSWAGIVFGLVALRAPGILEEIDLDPEADGLAVRSANRSVLITVAELVATAKRSQALFDAAIQHARLAGQIE